MTRERLAVIIILAHLAAASVHGISHAVLGVPAGSRAGLAVVVASVFVGPLVALAALLRGRRLAGALFLSTSMAAALIYGLAFHYVLRTPDHVAFAPPGLWGDAFGSSAAIIAVLEACGLAAGLLLTPFSRGGAVRTREHRAGARRRDRSRRDGASSTWFKARGAWRPTASRGIP